MRPITALSVIVSALLPFAAVAAQDVTLPCDKNTEQTLNSTAPDEVVRISAFTPARPIEKVTPSYPKHVAKLGGEGWVKMSYVIDTEGNVVDPVIDDFAGSQKFKRKALNALKQWKFAPAMKDGKPTQQCHQSVQFDFVLNQRGGARRSFVSQYKAIDVLIQQDELETARHELTALHESENRNRYENAWLWNLDATLAAKEGDESRELASLVRTLSSAKTHTREHATFDDDYMAYIHQRLFVLNVKAGQYKYALRSADALKAMDGQSARYEALRPFIDEVNTLIASEQPIAVPVTIDESGSRFHILARQGFGFSDIRGNLTTVEVRCDSHREKYTVAENVTWLVPESWGECRLLMEGDQGTAFRLIEVNAAAVTNITQFSSGADSPGH
ncbi:energy transducer TonB [Alteromonas sp. CYL-A6]|uniref:energy transducer TonB n=1 Tax=Alteromonas nitratireducens TaxID=3390813 RepID=UPI0034A8095D